MVKESDPKPNDFGQPGCTLGFVGTGLMGQGIARNLLRAGYPVAVLPGPRRSGAHDLAEAGAEIVERAADLTSCDVVFTCVPSSTIVEQLALESFLPNARENFVHIDLTSGDPAISTRLAKHYAAQSMAFVDAAMVGAPEQAAAAELSFVVGATQPVFDRVQPLLAKVSRHVVHAGAVGAGQRTKLIMSFIGMAMATSIAEAFSVANATGVSIAAIHELISRTAMNSSTFQAMAMAALDGDTSRRKLTIATARKDLVYLAAMTNDAVVTAPMTTATLQVLTRACAEGDGDAFVPKLTEILSRGCAERSSPRERS